MGANEKTEQLKSRLYWQCRRGMLELDSLLQHYFDKNFDSLDELQLKTFETLLQCSDELLLEYLMGRTVPVDAGIAKLVREIRQSFSTTH